MPEYDDLIAAGREHIWRWRLDEALFAFDRALRLRPDAAAAHYLRGEALFLQRRLTEALIAHAAAARFGVARDGTLGQAMSGMVPGDFAWMSHMLQGDFSKAWQLADADRERRQRAGIDCTNWPRHLRPVWNGAPLDGKKVLVRCYHGLGDTIQFMRYMPLLAERAVSVTVEIQPELLQLFSAVPGIDRLVPLSPIRDRNLLDLACEAEIDATELPYYFCTSRATLPGLLRLQPDPRRVEAARRRLAGKPGRRKIGLVWAAGAWKPERSIPPDRLAAIADGPDTGLVCLQRGPEYQRWHQESGGPPMLDLASDDIAETAATIATLDLVITVDTMVAHLAGTLGVPVWVMLHFSADWRWLLDCSESPWYPSMRLFRQPAPCDWRSVATEIATALSEPSGRAHSEA